MGTSGLLCQAPRPRLHHVLGLIGHRPEEFVKRTIPSPVSFQGSLKARPIWRECNFFFHAGKFTWKLSGLPVLRPHLPFLTHKVYSLILSGWWKVIFTQSKEENWGSFLSKAPACGQSLRSLEAPQQRQSVARQGRERICSRKGEKEGSRTIARRELSQSPGRVYFTSLSPKSSQVLRSRQRRGKSPTGSPNS